MSVSRPCPACEGNAFRPTLVVRGTTILACTRCGLATWAWESFDFEAFYDASYWKSADVGKGYADYFAMADAMSLTHRRRLSRLLARASGGRTPSAESLRLLDAGCGPGFFVRAANDAGLAAQGVEVSQFAVDFARRELGVDVRQGRLERGTLPDGPFEIVTLWDVIEHLPDPRAALLAVRDVLRPGGLVTVSTGDLATLVGRLSGPRWHLFNLPEHLWFFTRRSLHRLLESCGLAVVDVRYEVCWYPLRYLVERLESMFGRRRLLSATLGPVGRVALPVTLGDVVTMTARLPG